MAAISSPGRALVILVMLVRVFPVVPVDGYRFMDDGKLLAKGKLDADIVVAGDGSGNFKTISEGLDAAASLKNGVGRVVIYVKRGIYKEYVTVKKSMNNITMIGDGIDATVVTGSKSFGDGYKTLSSATFSVFGEGFIAMNMTFENTAGAAKFQAVALLCDSDRSVFYRCSFKGYQDTLYVHQDRQFFRECDIYGTIDFIFGFSAAVIQNSNIYLRTPLQGQQNVITAAQGRGDQKSGIVVQHSRIVVAPGETPGKSYLGRPWEQYSTSVYMQCSIDGVIEAQGWQESEDKVGLDTLYFAEYNNTGAGANTTGRVNWSGFHNITSADEAEKFTVERFLDGRSWLPATGVPFTPGL